MAKKAEPWVAGTLILFALFCIDAAIFTLSAFAGWIGLAAIFGLMAILTVMSNLRIEEEEKRGTSNHS